MTDTQKKETVVAHPNVNYTKIECPLCAAWIGQPCRNPKTLKRNAEGVFCEERIVAVNTIMAQQQSMLQRDLEYAQKRIAAYTDKRAKAFFDDYTKLVKQHGIAFSHEDSHGAFRIEDTNLDYLLTWALAATVNVTQPTGPSEPDERRPYFIRLDDMRAGFTEVLNAHKGISKSRDCGDMEDASSKFRIESAAFMADNLGSLEAILFDKHKLVFVDDKGNPLDDADTTLAEVFANS